MEELQEIADVEASDINEDNLYKKIWFEPTATLRFILQYCPEKGVFPLLILGGIGRAIDRASMKNMGDDMSTFAVLGIAFFAGALLGWITYYIYAWGMSVTGKWLKGTAEPEKFRTIIAYSLIPSICALALVIPEVMIFGDELFRSEPIHDSIFQDIMLLVFAMTKIILGIWSLVILVKGISLIQNFTTGKAVLNMFLPGIVLLVPLLLIVLVVAMFS